MPIIENRDYNFIVSVYLIEDGSLYERRVFSSRKELDKYLKTIVFENCEVSIVPDKISLIGFPVGTVHNFSN